MILSDPREAFKCLACESPRLLYNLDSLKMHFATEHGVVNLLSSPATKTVVPPSTFSCHADTCKPSELHSSCLFCGATGLQEEEMKSHLSSRHGAVFQQEWKHHCSHHCRCLTTVQWGWGGTELVDNCCATAITGIQTVRPKLVRMNNLLPRSLTRVVYEGALKRNREVEKNGESCQGNVEGVKERRVLDLAEEETLKQFKEVGKLGENCLEIVESEKEGKVLNSVVEEALKCCKEMGEVGEGSCQGTGEKRIEEEPVECCKEVAKLGTQGGLMLKGGDLEKERLHREILYRAMMEESGEVIERKLTYFTRALTDKGGKLANRIRRESGAIMQMIQSFEARERVVLRGPTEMIDKAEQMLEEILSSAVEIALSVDEKEALLRGSGEKKECILNKIRQRISVPISLRGSGKVVIYGKPEETKKAKEVFEEELGMVKKVLSSSR